MLPRRNLQVGDLVLLRDEQMARDFWPLASITASFPGKEGHVSKRSKLLRLTSFSGFNLFFNQCSNTLHENITGSLIEVSKHARARNVNKTRPHQSIGVLR